jgi:threonine aldolase
MIVDLRSDTVTKPTAEMYAAMATAELGDDVLGDEPTVKKLEALAAERMGKEAAVFVPSGTMANQASVASWTEPGDAIIVEEDCHLLYYETGAPGVFANVVTLTMPSQNGVMDPAYIAARITRPSLHTPTTKLLCLENTHNRAGGTVVPLSTMSDYRKLADEHGLRIHLDGARIHNAAIALRCPPSEIAKYADSVSFCLSKGLSCPIGSLITGPADFVARARVWRKRMGGAMRQAGILAACGIYALGNLVDRLKDDHRHARDFAAFINAVPGFRVDLETVQSNIVMVYTDEAAALWQERFETKGIRCFAVGPNKLRLVFHREIDDEKTEYAQSAVSELCGQAVR